MIRTRNTPIPRCEDCKTRLMNSMCPYCWALGDAPRPTYQTVRRTRNTIGNGELVGFEINNTLVIPVI
jgi:hypothetical protein